jgi:hypothetical protein
VRGTLGEIEAAVGSKRPLGEYVLVIGPPRPAAGDAEQAAGEELSR